MRFLLFIITFFCYCGLFAQSESTPYYFTFGTGPIAYKGDLNSSYQKFGINNSFSTQFNRRKRINGHLTLSFGSFSGQTTSYFLTDDDGNNYYPNNYFKTSFISSDYKIQINLIAKENLKVYFAPGLGIMRFSPNDEQGNSLFDQSTTRFINEDYNLISPYFPLSIGLNYFWKHKYSLGFQTGYVNNTSDYIDNISILGRSEKKDNLFYMRLAVGLAIRSKNKKGPETHRVNQPAQQ